MLAREWLIELCQRKQAILGPEYNYFDKRDKQDIERWKDSDCERVQQFIRAELLEGFYFFGPAACPWCVLCVLEDSNCDDCYWAHRHGRCSDTNSDWVVIEERISNALRHGRPLHERDCYKEAMAWIEEG